MQAALLCLGLNIGWIPLIVGFVYLLLTLFEDKAKQWTACQCLVEVMLQGNRCVDAVTSAVSVY